MRKIYFLLLSMLIIMLGFMPAKVSATSGNLTITYIGKTDKLPIGDWTTGIGETGRNYTINAIDLSKLITENNGKLTLCFDNFTINGNVELNFTGNNMDIDLTLLVTTQKGRITVAEGNSLTILTDEGKTSTITLKAKDFTNLENKFKADKVIFKNAILEYERMEMPGFTKWTQEELDKLIAAASHVGKFIDDKDLGGYKLNDFTSETKFTVENGVFTMTAEKEYSGTGMGFKNMDREGTLTGGVKLGDYPANFFNDLTGADGVRFKVDVKNGSAEYINIALSNCATDGFEYFIYNIPLTAADDEGYIALPIPLFEPEFWSANKLHLNNCKVFIMEVFNVTNGTSISFSDFHGYKLGESKDVDTTLSIAGETEICEGTSTTLTATSTADSYSWTCGEILLSKTNSVTIPDTMPAGEYTINLVATWLGGSIIPENQITVTRTIDVTINKADHVELTDTVNVGETYDKNGFDITPTEAGTTDHTLTLTNANGCDSVVVLHLTAIIPEGIHDFDIVRSIYPNPATNYITVQVSGQAMGSELRLYDMQGRLMKAQVIDKETIRIDLTTFANGVYLLKADSQTIKIIKQ